MATMTLAWVQTQIASLMAAYASAAAKPITEYEVSGGGSGRTVKKEALEDLMSQITTLSQIESELSSGSAGGMNVLVQFGDQV